MSRTLNEQAVSEDQRSGREILLGVTGSVAAYKAAEVVSRLVKRGDGVSVAMTAAASRFIGQTTFEALTTRPVYGSQWNAVEHYQGEHIGLAARADLYLIAPCSADMIGQLAGGLCGELVSLLATTIECPLLVAPAMNRAMWEKPAIQRNVATLRADGVQIVGPGEGWQSCRAVGTGRMAEPEEIVTAIDAALSAEV